VRDEQQHPLKFCEHFTALRRHGRDIVVPGGFCFWVNFAHVLLRERFVFIVQTYILHINYFAAMLHAMPRFDFMFT
jgi:hypothetical protein